MDPSAKTPIQKRRGRDREKLREGERLKIWTTMEKIWRSTRYLLKVPLEPTTRKEMTGEIQLPEEEEDQAASLVSFKYHPAVNRDFVDFWLLAN